MDGVGQIIKVKSGSLLEADLKNVYRNAYSEGIKIQAPWWLRLFGINWKRVKLPDSYKELFNG